MGSRFLSQLSYIFIVFREFVNSGGLPEDMYSLTNSDVSLLQNQLAEFEMMGFHLPHLDARKNFFIIRLLYFTESPSVEFMTIK